MKMDKNRAVLFFIGGGLTALFVAFYSFGVLKTIEYKTQDFRFHIRGERKRSPHISVICMGDESVSDNAMGRWPWSRKYHAILLNILSKFHPAMVMYDVLFTEKSRNEDDDRILAQQLKKLNVYFPMFCIIDKGQPKEINDPFQKLLLKRIKVPGKPNKSAYNAVSVVMPISRFVLGLAGSGYANAIPDPDGTTRRVSLLVKYKDKLYPHIAFLMALKYIGASWKDVVIKPGKYIKIVRSKVGKIKIPLDRRNQMLINYPGGLERYNPLSFLEVIDAYRSKRLSSEKLKKLAGRAIFVGLTATGTVDLRPTPFSPLFPMVGVVAATFSNIVDKNFLIPSSVFVDLLIIIITGALITYFSTRLKPLKAAVLSLIVIALWGLISYFLFLARIVVPVFYPASTGFFTFLGLTIYRVVSEEKEKKFIKNMFQRYVSSQVVDELIKNPEMLALGGQRRRLSIFFSDIRGFTSMSEKMEPEEIVAILNEYLTEMTEIIFKYKGTLDKFIGDAVMAIWGAPHHLSNHAELAIRAALEMQKKVIELCERWEKQGRKKIGIGMGINTGDVVIGNMGSANFSDYTVIGDNVNLAARLEENAKAGQILISQATFEEVADIVRVKKMPPLKVKGKERPVDVYEVLEI